MSTTPRVPSTPPSGRLSTWQPSPTRSPTADEVVALHSRVFDAWWDSQWQDPAYLSMRLKSLGGLAANTLAVRLTGTPLWDGDAGPRSEAEFLQARQHWSGLSYLPAATSLAEAALAGKTELQEDERLALVALIYENDYCGRNQKLVEGRSIRS